MEPWIEDLCRAMPKAELHLHLDGALEVKTALDLAEKSGWRGFPRPLGYAEMHRRLVVPHNLGSQGELLAYFEVPGLLLHTEEALRRVTRELIAAKAADRVAYMEIRWAPQLHTGGGLSPGEVARIVLEESRACAARFGVRVRLIAVAMRTHTLAENMALLEALAPISREIAAVDYAGPEAQNPHALERLPFFAAARELGLGITFHCGELPGSAGRLRSQAEAIRPHRIAHGPGAAEDPELMAWLRDQDIMLDLCPTSNLQAGLYPGYREYPLQALVAGGVPVSVSTDDSVLSGLRLSDEYIRLLAAGQLDLPTLWRLNLNALAHAFLPEAEKQALGAEFAAWAKNIPQLAAEKYNRPQDCQGPGDLL